MSMPNPLVPRSMLSGALAAAMLAGCASSRLPSPTIIDGEPDFEHTNVVRISWGDGVHSGAICSGTYIGSGRIVTAQHCVPVGSSDMISVTFVDYRDTDGESALRMTGSHDEPPPDASGDGLARVVIDDSSIAALPFDVPAMPRLPENAPPLSPDDTFTAIGFGATSPPTVTAPQGAGYDTRHKGQVELSELSSDMAWMIDGPDAAAPCNGDSGGPLVVTRAGVDYLVGVLLDGDCSTRMQYIRPDIPPNSTFVDSPTPPCNGCDEPPVGTTCVRGSPSGAISVLGVMFVVRRRRSKPPGHHRSSKLQQPGR